MTQLFQGPLVDASSGLAVPLLDLKLSHFEVHAQFRVRLHVPIHHLALQLLFSHALLEVEVGHPGLLLGFPSHPALEDLPRGLIVAQDFLHVGVLEPELIHARHHVDRPFENVPGVVDEFVSHLHLDILHPEAHVEGVHLEGAFENGTRTAEFEEALFKLRVANPNSQVVPLAAHSVFEEDALAEFVLLQLGLIHNALLGRSDLLGLVDFSVLQQLLRCDLYFVGLLVEDGGWAHFDEVAALCVDHELLFCDRHPGKGAR